MKTKNESVKMNLKKEMSSVIPMIETYCKAVEGESYEITVTSAKDGKHMRKSKHYTGEAIDIRTRDMKYKQIVKNVLQLVLEPCFDVVLESDHIHIEYDIK